MLIDVRDAKPQDVSAILALWACAGATPSATDSAEDLLRAITLDFTAVLVAEDDGRMVGSVIGGFDGWRGNVYRLAVEPAFRRRGVARRLIEEIDSRFREWGVARVTALVEREHTSALSFWETTAYVLDGRMVRYVGTLRGPTA